MARRRPEAPRLQWFKKCGVSERAVWVTKFRAGTDTLGHVIQTVYIERDAHWEVSPALRTVPASPVVLPLTPGKGGKGGRPNKRGKGGEVDPPQWEGAQQATWDSNQSKLTPGALAKTLRDGTKLCPDFQAGKCKVKQFKCPKGVHKCGRVLKNGRVCGMPYHGAQECKRK